MQKLSVINVHIGYTVIVVVMMVMTMMTMIRIGGGGDNSFLVKC